MKRRRYKGKTRRVLEKVFEETRKKAIQGNQTKGSHLFNFSNHKIESSLNIPVRMTEYFQKIDFESESLAKKYTIQLNLYYRKSSKVTLNYLQVFQVDNPVELMKIQKLMMI